MFEAEVGVGMRADRNAEHTRALSELRLGVRMGISSAELYLVRGALNEGIGLEFRAHEERE